MKPLKLQTLTAYVAVGPDGDEGIMGALMPDNTWFALIGADAQRLTELYPMAVDISRKCGRPFRVLQFSVREDITEKVIAEMQGQHKN